MSDASDVTAKEMIERINKVRAMMSSMAKLANSPDATDEMRDDVKLWFDGVERTVDQTSDFLDSQK